MNETVRKDDSADVHTRIYQMFAPTIELDEMSLSLQRSAQGDVVDPSTGMHTADTSNQDSVTPNQGNASSTNLTKNIGNTSPLIRINDRYYGVESI